MLVTSFKKKKKINVDNGTVSIPFYTITEIKIYNNNIFFGKPFRNSTFIFISIHSNIILTYLGTDIENFGINILYHIVFILNKTNLNVWYILRILYNKSW